MFNLAFVRCRACLLLTLSFLMGIPLGLPYADIRVASFTCLLT